MLVSLTSNLEELWWYVFFSGGYNLMSRLFSVEHKHRSNDDRTLEQRCPHILRRLRRTVLCHLLHRSLRLPNLARQEVASETRAGTTSNHHHAGAVRNATGSRWNYRNWYDHRNNRNHRYSGNHGNYGNQWVHDSVLRIGRLELQLGPIYASSFCYE